MRRLIAVLLVLTAGLTLAACRAQPGTAAYVGDQRITSADIDRFVAEAYDDPAGGAQLKQASAPVRLQVVQTVVLLRLLRYTADEVGVRVDQSSIDDLRKTIAALPLESRPQDIQLVSPDLGARFRAYLEALAQHFQGANVQPDQAQTPNTALVDEVRRQATLHPVQINPRYGSFDAQNLSFTG
jgi:parvulin-like peptidyl-prolyl isomerase